MGSRITKKKEIGFVFYTTSIEDKNIVTYATKMNRKVKTNRVWIIEDKNQPEPKIIHAVRVEIIE